MNSSWDHGSETNNFEIHEFGFESSISLLLNANAFNTLCQFYSDVYPGVISYATWTALLALSDCIRFSYGTLSPTLEPTMEPSIFPTIYSQSVADSVFQSDAHKTCCLDGWASGTDCQNGCWNCVCSSLGGTQCGCIHLPNVDEDDYLVTGWYEAH